MVTAKKPLINLLKGWPNAALAPSNAVRTASNVVLSDPETSTLALRYGPDGGYEPLRVEIAKWLTAFYAPSTPIPSTRVAISGGASQNLARVLQGFTDPVYTRNVWMIAPTYFLACRIFEDGGFTGKLRAVPEDDQGVDIDFLKTKIKESEDKATADGNTVPKLKPDRPWNKMYKHIIYCVPTFANPSAKTMSLLRRQQLVRVARDFDALIITDDVYDFLQFPAGSHASETKLDRAIQPRLVDVDRTLDGGAEREGADGFGNATSNGSFSKLIGPGCRTGWAEGTDRFAYGLSQVGSSRSGGAPSQLVATFVSEMLSTGALQEHIFSVLQPAYAARYRRMLSAIETHLLPLGVTIPPQPDVVVSGGYFIWFTLPEPLAAKDVARRAVDEQNVTMCHGDLFEVYGDEDAARFGSNIRLCFAFEEEERIPEGVERLASVVRDMLQEGRTQVAKSRQVQSGQSSREAVGQF